MSAFTSLKATKRRHRYPTKVRVMRPRRTKLTQTALVAMPIYLAMPVDTYDKMISARVFLEWCGQRINADFWDRKHERYYMDTYSRAGDRKIACSVIRTGELHIVDITTKDSDRDIVRKIANLFSPSAPAHRVEQSSTDEQTVDWAFEAMFA